jgi:hypothetical protein
MQPRKQIKFRDASKEVLERSPRNINTEHSALKRGRYLNIDKLPINPLINIKATGQQIPGSSISYARAEIASQNATINFQDSS